MLVFRPHIELQKDEGLYTIYFYFWFQNQKRSWNSFCMCLSFYIKVEGRDCVWWFLVVGGFF